MPRQLEKSIDEAVKNGHFETAEYLRDFKGNLSCKVPIKFLCFVSARSFKA